MSNQRQLRENTLQLFYAYQLADDELPENVAERFFHLTQEPQREALYSPIAKWILTQATPFLNNLSKVEDQVELTLPQIKVVKNSASLLTVLSQWLASGHLFAQSLVEIKKLKSASNQEEKTKLKALNDASLEHAKHLSLYERQLKTELLDLPVLLEDFSEFFSLISQTATPLSRVLLVATPETYNEHEQFQGIHKKALKIAEEREQILTFFNKVIANNTSVSEKVLPLVKNFSEDRLDIIETSILILGGYELLHTKEERSYVMNDWIELAKKYSTQNSSKFINGVLDQL